MFLSTWNLHRSPDLWERPNEFEPERFERTFSNPSISGWAGYEPGREGGSLYPNEVCRPTVYLHPP